MSTATRPPRVDGDQTEAFAYTLIDGDGDVDSGLLSVAVNDVDPTPVSSAVQSGTASGSMPALKVVKTSLDPMQDRADSGDPLAPEVSNDPIFGNAGELLIGSAGGNIVIDGNGENTNIVIGNSDVGSEVVQVAGFDAGGDAANADTIDISDVLDAAGYDEAVDALADFVNVTLNQDGGVSIAVDLSGTGSNYTEVALLQADAGGAPLAIGPAANDNFTGTALQQLVNDGVLITG